MSAHAPYILLLLLAAGALHAQPRPFEDQGFTIQSADNDPDLVVVRERYDAETRRQSIYLRSFDGTADHTTHSGELVVTGARVVEVITDGAALAEGDAMWGIEVMDYGAAAIRGLEGEVAAHEPAPRDGDDAIRVAQRRVRFWFGATNDIDDARVILAYDEEPTSARFSVTLFGGRRADPDGYPVTTQGGVHVGNLVDRVPDDGDYSEVFEVEDIKLLIEDFDIVERVVALGAVEADGPVGPGSFTIDNYAEGDDLDQDNGFDQNGVLTPIASATDLDNLDLEIPDLETDRGDVIPAEQLMVVGFPETLAHGESAVVEVAAEIPADTAPGVYKGQLQVWEDNNTDGRRGAREPADSVRVSVVVGTPPDAGFDLGFPDAVLPDAAPDLGPDLAVEDAAPDTLDAGADGGPPTDAGDVGPDQGADAGPDASPDGAPDTAPDSSPDAAADVADGRTDVPDLAVDGDAGPPPEPADLEPVVFDPGDARGGAFSCSGGGDAPAAWWLLGLALLRRRGQR